MMDHEPHLTEAQHEMMEAGRKRLGLATIEEYLLHLMTTDQRTPEQHAQWRAIMKASEGDHSAN